MDGAFCFKNGTHLSKLIGETSTLTRELDGASHRAAVACLLRLALPHVNTMPPSENAVNEHGYARQILHADPDGLFTVMALRWLPGLAPRSMDTMPGAAWVFLKVKWAAKL